MENITELNLNDSFYFSSDEQELFKSTIFRVIAGIDLGDNESLLSIQLDNALRCLRRANVCERKMKSFFTQLEMKLSKKIVFIFETSYI